MNGSLFVTCGGYLICDLPGFIFVEVYSNNVPDLIHEPTIYVDNGSKTISVHDGLLEFKDFPTAFGGSSEIATGLASRAHRLYVGHR